MVGDRGPWLTGFVYVPQDLPSLAACVQNVKRICLTIVLGVLGVLPKHAEDTSVIQKTVAQLLLK